MDFWAFILAAACLGTFVLEVWGFWKIIKLITNIKEGLGISEDGTFSPGEMLKNAVVSIGLVLGEVDEKGKPTEANLDMQQALANIFGYGAAVVKQQFMGAMNGDGTMDVDALPKKYRGPVALANALGINLGDIVKGFGKKAVKKASDNVLDGWQ